MPHGLDTHQINFDIHSSVFGTDYYTRSEAANTHHDARAVWMGVHVRSSDRFVQAETIRGELYSRFDLREIRCCPEYVNGRNSDTLVQPETIRNELDTFDLRTQGCQAREYMNGRNLDILVQAETTRNELDTFDLRTQCPARAWEYVNGRNSDTLVQAKTIRDELDKWFYLKVQCRPEYMKSN